MGKNLPQYDHVNNKTLNYFGVKDKFLEEKQSSKYKNISNERNWPSCNFMQLLNIFS